METSIELLLSEAFLRWRDLCRSSGSSHRRREQCFDSWRIWARTRRNERELLAVAMAAARRARMIVLLELWREKVVEDGLPVRAYGTFQLELLRDGGSGGWATMLRAAYHFMGRRANAAVIVAWSEWKRLTRSSKGRTAAIPSDGSSVDKWNPSEQRRGRRCQRSLEAKEWMTTQFDSSYSNRRNVMLIKWMAKREVEMATRHEEMTVRLARDDDILKRASKSGQIAHTSSFLRYSDDFEEGLKMTFESNLDPAAKSLVPISPVAAACLSPISEEVHQLLSPPRVSVLDGGSANLLHALSAITNDIVSAKECSKLIPESTTKESARRKVASLRSKTFEFDSRGSIEARLSSRRRARSQCIKDIDAHCCICEGRHVGKCGVTHKRVLRDDCSWLRNKRRVLSYHEKCIEEANDLIRHQNGLLEESRSKQEDLKRQLNSCCRSLEHSLEKAFMRKN